MPDICGGDNECPNLPDGEIYRYETNVPGKRLAIDIADKGETISIDAPGAKISAPRDATGVQEILGHVPQLVKHAIPAEPRPGGVPRRKPLPIGEQNVYIGEVWVKEGVFPCVPCQSFLSCSRFSPYHPSLPTMPAAAKAAAAKAAQAGAGPMGPACPGLRSPRFAARLRARHASRRTPSASASASKRSPCPSQDASTIGSVALSDFARRAGRGRAGGSFAHLIVTGSLA